MRNIRVADPRDRVLSAPPALPRPRSRRARIRDWVLTIPVVLLVPAIIVISMPAAAGGATLSASPAAALAGARMSFGGTGFAPQTEGTIVLDGDAATLGHYRVSNKGRFRVNAKLPKAADAGRHHVEAVDEAGTIVAELEVEVLATQPDPTPAPTDPPAPTPEPTPAPTAAPTATPAPTPAPTSAPTATPSPTAPPSTPSPSPVPTASGSVTPSSTPPPAPAASPSATPAPTPTASPPSTTPLVKSGSILMDRSTLLALPMTGTAWTKLLERANLPAAAPNLTNQDDPNDVTALAKALVYARTGIPKYRDDTVAMLKAAVGTEYPGDTLGIARGVAPLVLAADLVGWRDPAWMSWISKLRTWQNPDRGYSLISMQELRPMNWGTHAGAGRIAADLYLGDAVDLAKAAKVFKGYLGDRASYNGFKYGSDLTWQSSKLAPVGVNPTGSTINGMNVDGILPDDMRRGGSFPTVGADGQSYTWEALQGVLLQSELLSRAGYPAWAWQDRAVLRAFTRINALGYPAAGDDMWQPWLVNRRYGTSFPAPVGTHPGKSFGYADWLYGR